MRYNFGVTCFTQWGGKAGRQVQSLDKVTEATLAFLAEDVNGAR